MPELTITTDSGITVISFPPDTNLDSVLVETFRQPLIIAIEQAACPVILDASNVQFASSQAIGLLVTLRLKAARTGHRFALASLRSNIAGVLEVMQMTRLFELFPTVAEARRSLIESADSA